jgi:hypothetical protein
MSKRLLVEHNSNIKNIYVKPDEGVPVIIGQCPECNNGHRSLIIIDFKQTSDERGNLTMQCMACNSKYKTDVRYAG